MERDSPFGVLEFLPWNQAWNAYKYPDNPSLEKAVLLMKEAGVGWVRMDFLWQDIEPKAGEIHFAQHDYIVDLLLRHNLKVLGVLGYSAPWAASCGQWNCPPKDDQLFVNYAVKVASHYKGKIKYWEIWNEPDSRIYWANQDGLKSYCAFLKDTYAALKKLDPECKILNGGFAEGLSSVNRLYDNGARDYFDIMNIHAFDSPLHDGAMERVAGYPKAVRKVMERHQDGKKELWITETGSPGVPDGITTGNWWMGANPTEAEQAEFLKNVLTKLTEDKAADKIFWAFFRDCKGHWGNGVDYFGLVRWDFSKKPSFNAYKEVTALWRSGTLQSQKPKEKLRGISPWQE